MSEESKGGIRAKLDIKCDINIADLTSRCDVFADLDNRCDIADLDNRCDIADL